MATAIYCVCTKYNILLQLLSILIVIHNHPREKTPPFPDGKHIDRLGQENTVL